MFPSAYPQFCLISTSVSSLRSRPAIHDQVMAALSTARLTTWEGLLAEQRAYLDDFWASAEQRDRYVTR